MPTQNISLDNADTESVVFKPNGGADKEVCYLVIDGQEVWRKNPITSDLQTGNLTPRGYYNTGNGYGRQGFLGRIFPAGIGSGSTNTYITVSDQPGVQRVSGQTAGAIQIFNRGAGFTSGAQVEGFLNAGTHPWNRSTMQHTFRWHSCTLNSTGGIQSINIGDVRNSFSNGTSTGNYYNNTFWNNLGGNNNKNFTNGNHGEYDDENEEPNYERSIILGNKGTIMIPYFRFEWGSSGASYQVVNGAAAIWRYFGAYGSSYNYLTAGRTQNNLPSIAWTEDSVYVPVVDTFGSQHSSRSDVTSFGGMLLKDFEKKSHEFTGHTCGESFAKLRFSGEEPGGEGD